MNYRHAFHAGNHGDVLKHVILARVLSYMTAKDKPLALLDAHAGIGVYDLQGVEAFKTGEWEQGVGKLLAFTFSDSEAALLAPYLEVLRQLNGPGHVRRYCGSPELAARLLRPQDRLYFNELHPEDHALLSQRYLTDVRVRVSNLDALQAVKAALPFKEKRGVVLLDPAFEKPDDSQGMVRMFAAALQRMAQTVVIGWYPVTTMAFADALTAQFAASSIPGLLHVRLMVREAHGHGGLSGSGLVIANPPYVLEGECRTLIPALARALAVGQWGRGTVEWLTTPKA